ncbi:hypothetical protein BKA62DRAFT_507121 [Auriculariales sp. MPI-PUGE-AT-0066]|nr:hypothetical protein BKA62DRAFT_507121 [Auriculariales sp. MPI-PUGE-AT-0066]
MYTPRSSANIHEPAAILHGNSTSSRLSTPFKLTLRWFLAIALLLYLLNNYGASAKHTQAACAGNDFIQPSVDGNSICYWPSPLLEDAISQQCYSPEMDAVLKTHVAATNNGANLFGYYSIANASFIGDSNWSVNSWMEGLQLGQIVSCQTGLHAQDTYLSRCYIAIGDEDFGSSSNHNTCVYNHGRGNTRGLTDDPCAVVDKTRIFTAPLEGTAIIFAAIFKLLLKFCSKIVTILY